MRRMTRGQFEPFTSTESPWDIASAIIPRESKMASLLVSFEVSLVSSGSGSSSVVCRASRDDERINVAETDVISRTASVRWGVHGRIVCHSEGLDVDGSGAIAVGASPMSSSRLYRQKMTFESKVAYVLNSREIQNNIGSVISTFSRAWALVRIPVARVAAARKPKW